MNLLKMPIESRQDLGLIRREIAKMTKEAGYSPLVQVQICTAVAEVVRNVLLYAGKGGITARMRRDKFVVEVWDKGKGIPLETLAELENGTYKSKTGLGKGINGTKNLMDRVRILTSPSGTQLFMEKALNA